MQALPTAAPHTRDRGVVRGRARLARFACVSLLIASLASVLACNAFARDRKEHVPQIRVVGRATVTSAPDRVSVDVSVSTRSDSAVDAAERNAQEASAVVAKLREAFPEAAEVSTGGYTLSPEYEYDKREGRRKPAGFSARNTVHVVLSDVGAAGRLIDAAVGAGANEVRSVRFTVADPSDLERQALNDAAADARAKAEALAASVGVKVGRILRVEERGAGPVEPRLAVRAMAEADTTPIEPGDVFFEASVTLWVELVEK